MIFVDNKMASLVSMYMYSTCSSISYVKNIVLVNVVNEYTVRTQRLRFVIISLSVLIDFLDYFNNTTV